jgi:hypothetical protein
VSPREKKKEKKREKLTLEADPKEDVIQEEKRDARTGDLLGMRIPRHFVIPQQDRDHQITAPLAERGVHEHLPATPALDVGDPDEREEQVRYAVAGGEEAGHLVVEADGGDEDGGEVVGCDVNSWRARTIGGQFLFFCASFIILGWRKKAGDDFFFAGRIFALPENCCMNCAPIPKNNRLNVPEPALAVALFFPRSRSRIRTWCSRS